MLAACVLPLVSLSGSALPDWTPSTRQTDQRRPAPPCPRAPTARPRGTTGTTPSGAATARPADSTRPRARKGTMYVISSILLPHPHSLPPPPNSNGIYHSLCKYIWSSSFVLVDMNSHLLRYWKIYFLTLSSVIPRRVFLVIILLILTC